MTLGLEDLQRGAELRGFRSMREWAAWFYFLSKWPAMKRQWSLICMDTLGEGQCRFGCTSLQEKAAGLPGFQRNATPGRFEMKQAVPPM